MSGDGGWEELLKQAAGRLAEQEAAEQDTNVELGESVDLDEGQTFVGRWRGHGTAATQRGNVDVYLLWDAEGARRFVWPKTRLRWEIDELQPQVGDHVAIVRGRDIPATSPDRNPMQRYAVAREPCDDPLPDDPGGDADIPF